MGDYLLIIGLMMFSAVIAGIGTVVPSMNPYDLKRRAETGDKAAEKLFDIRKHNNLLLVTLITAGVTVDVLISIHLSKLLPYFSAVILATVLLTIFTKIIPGSIYILHIYRVGGYTAWLAKLLIKFLYPICKPIAMILDRVVGKDKPNNFSRKELVKFIEEHGTAGSKEIEADEMQIARGALSFGEKPIKAIMTPRRSVFCVRPDQVINRSMIKQIVKSRHSRIPVVDVLNNRIAGVIYAQRLLDEATIGKQAQSICDPKTIILPDDTSQDKALHIFLEKRHHLGIVVNEFQEIVGVVSLEDILEEILGQEIVDELDQYINTRSVPLDMKRNVVN